MNGRIAKVVGRRIWDSRGRPTIEVDVMLEGGAIGRGVAPAGASTGSAEALELRDGGNALGGFGVSRALAGVNGEINSALQGMDAAGQEAIDARLMEIDGTPKAARLGANALIATSLAVASAAAAAARQPLWRHLAGGTEPQHLPLPEIQIFGGGAHAGRRVDVQDFMVIAVSAPDYATALEWTAEVYRAAGDLMCDAGRLQGVADEGGWWPAFDSNEEALEYLLRAIERARLAPGEQMAISLDIAASEFGRKGQYMLARDGRKLDSDGLADMLLGWLGKFPIVSIEDPLGEDDPDGLAAFTRAAGSQVQVVGDDFLCTDAVRIATAARAGQCNCTLIKPNQIGTLTHASTAVEAARKAGWGTIVSARSGETEDAAIAHIAVGWGIRQLKVGSFARSERMAKWNEGLRIAETAACGGALPPRSAFPWGGRK
ncbi:MAG: enolase C-terminal domain-like protein [Pseudomonadota bacterium]|nr:enolase C-terminal domain-like protein [Pseudomonadota bacterium]